MNDMQLIGNVGTYVDDKNSFTFQVGSTPSARLGDEDDPGFDNRLGGRGAFAMQWLNVSGYNVYARGDNNLKCEELENDIKKNRLLPRLISKQINMLYGSGPSIYKSSITNGKRVKEWVEEPTIMAWLESWQENGMEMSHTDFALGLIKNYYYFRDYFVKWRMSLGASIGAMPVAGLELIDNRRCRLGTNKTDVVTALANYSDFRFVLVGNWMSGAAKFSVYPKFNLNEVKNYRYAAVSHHREMAVGDFYGCNETHEGARAFIKGSNETAEYINSFLHNSLAAKVHIIIPNAWVESKRKSIKLLCDENKSREAKKDKLLTYNGIEVGTSFKESSLIQFVQTELRKLSKYLSGSGNQGKAYSSISFRSGNNEEERWKIETVDLKYKEYISSIIEYDKRADEVLLASVGLDSSISSVSKDGVISKSGADVYYNYLIYLMSLTPDDEKCSEPFNMAIKVNFPALYKAGYRIGYYRETPSRQEEVSPKDRINTQQS